MKSVRSAFIAGALIACAAVAHAQDFSKVQIKANKVTDKFYTLDGQGGTTGILVGPDGVFMVDTQFALLNDKIACGHQADYAPAGQVRRHLNVGAPANVAILELRERQCDFLGNRRLFPGATVLAGKHVAQG